MVPSSLLTAFAFLAVGLLAVAPATSASAAPDAHASGALPCTPAVLVSVCVESSDCIVVLVAGRPFAIVGCA